MDTIKIEELKKSIAEIRETAEILESKLEKFLKEEDPQKRIIMQKLIESAINLLQFEFKRTIILDIDELKDYFTDIKYLHLLKHHTYCFHPLEQ
jgi:archaellum component FlaC